MGIIKTKGIVIKVANSSENDKILTVLTADLGKINVFCKGAKKNKGALLSGTEIMAFSDMILFSGNSELYNLNSLETIEVFFNLRMDIEKLSYAAVMLQMINDVCMEGETCYKKLQLLLNTLYTLSETNKNKDLIFSVFQIRLLRNSTDIYHDFGKCVNCNMKTEEMKKMYFSIKDNGIKCEACSKQDKGAIEISEIAYTSILYILSAMPKKIFSFEIPNEAINELKLISKIYVTEKLEKEYLTMENIKKVGKI